MVYSVEPDMEDIEGEQQKLEHRHQARVSAPDPQSGWEQQDKLNETSSL